MKVCRAKKFKIFKNIIRFLKLYTKKKEAAEVNLAHSFDVGKYIIDASEDYGPSIYLKDSIKDNLVNIFVRLFTIDEIPVPVLDVKRY